jgi:hypothetical protein
MRRRGTIACGKNGDIVVVLDPKLRSYDDERCGINDCLRRHEQVHADEARRQRPLVCGKGSAGLQIDFSPGEQGPSERAASLVEIACLRGKLLSPQCGCKDTIQDRINKVTDYYNTFK